MGMLGMRIFMSRWAHWIYTHDMGRVWTMNDDAYESVQATLG